jgi:hypothetical protein
MQTPRHRKALTLRTTAGLLGLALIAAITTPASAASHEFGRAPRNPYTAPAGTATMHGDSASSDTTPLGGPEGAVLSSALIPLAAACPTIMVGSDHYPVALCTQIANRAPIVYLLDPTTGRPLASLALKAGNLFGGVYAYLDKANRLVLIDGTNTLIRVAHHRTSAGIWSLRITRSIPLGRAFTRECGSPTCDTVVGLAPDWHGNVWFATAGALVGTVNPRTHAVHLIRLHGGEHVDNSISTVPGRAAVATDHALYLLRAGRHGRPRIMWRRPYNRGPARKPGQLSHGTGATPVFFGPGQGDRYVTITDNASPHEHLLVFKAKRGALACKTTVLRRSAVSGTEDAPIASGRSVIVTDTYGYPYPATPADAGPAKPATAPFVGGMTRVDLKPGGGCAVRWDTLTRSAALPRLSLADHAIDTVIARDPTATDSSGAADIYSYAVINPDTGTVTRTALIGAGEPFDMLELTGTTAPHQVLYQGTLTGIVRITGTSATRS